MSTTYISTKDAAALIRRALAEAFPGVKFSVRKSTGTASSWIRVTWTDGPTMTECDAVTSRFQSERWNGMIDGYDSIPGRNYLCSGVNHERNYSLAAGEWAAAMVARHPGRWDRPGDWNPAESAARRVLTATNLMTIPEVA